MSFVSGCCINNPKIANEIGYRGQKRTEKVHSLNQDAKSSIITSAIYSTDIKAKRKFLIFSSPVTCQKTNDFLSIIER